MEKVLFFRPEYFSKFKCDGSKCDAQCCKKWHIFFDKETYKRYSERSDSQEIIKYLKFNQKRDAYLLSFDERKACPFLSEDNLCSLQLKHGEDFLSLVCRTYPRVILNFGGFVEQSLNLSCPLVGELVLLEREPLKFEIFQAELQRYEISAWNVPEKFFSYLMGIQIAQISILQERTLTIDQRLIVMGFFLDKLDEMSAQNVDEDALKKLIAAYESKKFLAEQVPRILESVTFDAKNFIRLMIKLFNALHTEINVEYLNRVSKAFSINPNENNCVSLSKVAANYEQLTSERKIFLKKYSVMIENYLVNDFFMNCYPWRFKEDILTNFAMFITTYKILEFILFASMLEGKNDLKDIIVWFARQTDHNYGVRPKIYEQIKDEGDLFSLMESLLKQ